MCSTDFLEYNTYFSPRKAMRLKYFVVFEAFCNIPTKLRIKIYTTFHVECHDLVSPLSSSS